VFVAIAAAALAVVSGTSASRVASPGDGIGSGHGARAFIANDSGTRSAATPAQNDSTGLARWAACERSHGDPDQADPTVAHQVIYIAIQMGALPGWNPQDASAPCGQYLAAAQRAVAGGQRVDGWGDEAVYVAYVNCIRANGYPSFPYPSGVEPDGHLRTNFNGTGIDPNSPAFLNGSANQTCGKQVGAPAWWINSWGPPGSVDVYPAGTNPNSPLPTGAPAGGPKPTGAPSVGSAIAGNAPSVAGG